MKQRKTAAVILSAAMFCSALPSFPAVYASAADVPSWVPASLEEAVNFQNTYGTTRAGDGVYCICERVDNSRNPNLNEVLAEGSAERIFRKEIVYEPQDGMPDLNSMPAEERAEWEAKLEQEGMIADYNKNVHYFVSVWKPTQAGNNTVTRQYTFDPADGENSGTATMQVPYTFTVADDVLHVAETGWRAYTPDCKTEYDAFMSEHDGFFAQDDFIVLAGTVNGSTGETMNMHVTLNGDDVDDEWRTACTKQSLLPPDPGSSEQYARFYRIRDIGDVKARISLTQSDSSTLTREKNYIAGKEGSGRICLYDASIQQNRLPDWVPEFYSDACNFQNNYGNSYVEDGVICIVSRYDTSQTLDASNCVCEPVDGTDNGDCVKLLDKLYIPQEIYTDSYGREYTDSSSFAVNPDGLNHYYHVTVWKASRPGVFMLCEEPTEASAAPDMFRFTIADDLSITETDWRGYVPDCQSEYESFIYSSGSGNGLGSSYDTTCNVDGRGDYLIFASNNDYTIHMSYNEIEATLEGKKLSWKTSDCSHRFSGPVDADGVQFADYVQITKPGTIKVKVTHNKNTVVTEQTLAAIRRNDGTIYVVRMPDENVPSWAPTSFEQASEFPLYKAVSGKLVLCIPFTVSEDFDYVLDDPGMAGGSANHKLLSTECYTEGDRGYLVEVYNVLSEGNFGMKWLRVPKEGKSIPQARLYTLSFEVDETLKARETELNDLFPADYDTAGSKDSILYVKNGFILGTGSGSGSTGYSAFMEVTGSAIADPVMERDYSRVPVADHGQMPSGGTQYTTFLYKPVRAGILKVKVGSCRSWDRSEDIVDAVKYFKVNDDLSLTEITIEKGDLNGDKDTTTADLVALSKYLSGAGTLTEQQIFAADMKDDNRINAADLSVMKQKLLAAKAK